MLEANLPVEGHVAYGQPAEVYNFQLTQPSFVQLWLTEQSHPSANFDLQNAAGELVTYCTNFGNLSGLMEAELEPGVYTVRVYSPEENQYSTYKLELKVAAGEPGLDISTSMEDAFPITTGRAVGLIDAYYNTHFENPGDVDFYRFDLMEDASMRVGVIAGFESFELLDRDGHVLDMNTYNRNGYPAGTYYIRIKGFTGPYKLYIHPFSY